MPHSSSIQSPIGRRLIIYIVLFSSFITLFITAVQLYRDYNIDIEHIHDELEQIVQNLLANAIRYGAEGKKVHLRVKIRPAKASKGPRVVTSVRDFGPGIAKKHIPRLTERFYQVDKQSSRSTGGTGLGLAIVKHLVQRHRGRLKIESKPGKGAKFSIELPLLEIPDTKKG